MEAYEYLEKGAISIKARSKKEMYDMLSSKGGFYLP